MEEELYLLCRCWEKSENRQKSCTCEMWIGKGTEKKKIGEIEIGEILFY